MMTISDAVIATDRPSVRNNAATISTVAASCRTNCWVRKANIRMNVGRNAARGCTRAAMK